MNRQEAIAQANELIPNAFDDEMKMDWLQDCELLIQHDIIEKYENPPATPKRDDIELTMPEPYSSGYVDYLHAMIAKALKELDEYSVHISLFENWKDRFARDYMQHHNLKYPKINRFIF